MHKPTQNIFLEALIQKTGKPVEAVHVNVEEGGTYTDPGVVVFNAVLRPESVLEFAARAMVDGVFTFAQLALKADEMLSCSDILAARRRR